MNSLAGLVDNKVTPSGATWALPAAKSPTAVHCLHNLTTFFVTLIIASQNNNSIIELITLDRPS